jgi:Mannosyltransferase (PIG-V)
MRQLASSMPGTAEQASGSRVASRVAAVVDARRTALADVWLALWTSRLAVWLAAVYAVLTVGYRPTGGAPHTGAPFGNFGELVFGVAQRWDATFYLSIAGHGYHSVQLSAFYPLYPLAIKAVGVLSGSQLIAGIAVSLISFASALYLLHRLVTLELGGEHARTAVLSLAFFPTAMFFSVVYPQALLLSLTIGAVYAARTGHWAWAGILGALASATHNSGVLVAIPIGLLYLYGPRADRDRAPEASTTWWLPRHRPGIDFLWLALVPLGLVAFFAYTGIEHGDVFQSLHVNDTLWHRHFELFGGITGIASVVWHGFHTIASAPPDRLFPATNGLYRGAAVNMVDAAALIFALFATVGVIRRLPFAYSAYTVISLAIFTSAPKATEPLMSLPRFILVLFPLQMWLALWLDKRGRAGVWIACSGIALGVASMQFATGRWVA